jgi:epidermal growth factor receptor substrate 15
VLRLIGHYQAGQDPTPELAFKPGPLPKFDGNLGTGGVPLPPPGPPPGQLRPQVSGGPIRVPPLTPEKVNQYSALFEKSGAQDGILPGEQAKQIFEKAGLPNEILGGIWNLADTEQRGALVLPEFIIAMHLLASFKSGSLRALPSILPAGLYEAATRRIPPARQVSNIAPSASPISAIPRQFSGANGGRAGSPLGRSAYGATPQAPQPTGQGIDWAISPMDKAQFDGIYAGLDKANRGFITGDEAVPFFSNSKLPEEVLAQIWDLADINSEGRLNRDEFAVAMYLIRQQRSKRDGRDTLPSSLPPNLVPPSMRSQTRAPAQAAAPVFDPSAGQMSKSAADDLFGLDALSTPLATSAPAQVPLSTGSSAGFGGDPFGNTRTPLTPSSPAHAGTPPHHQTSFKPFVPSSTFGQTLAHSTPSASSSPVPAQQARAAPAAIDDLLGDSDPEVSKKLTNETTELANLSNQVGTLSKQMQEVQAQRSTSQNELNQATTQKREFELRLSQLRSLYEQEAKDVRSLQERLTTSRNETKKLQQEIAMIEGTYQDLQNQHRQIVTALQADQQENASLKERMRVLNAEIAQMKPQLEKLKSEARQQKGLVAINKKQLATNESERDKLKTEADELTKSNEEQARAIAASAQAQSPPPVASPTLSTMSANNPFFRRQASISSDVASPPFARSPAQEADRSFENVFGPSFAVAETHRDAGMPLTTLKQEVEPSHGVPSPAMTTSLPTRPAESSEVGSPSLSQRSTSPREMAQPIEPPAPPESRQISSSFLPFPPERNNSLSSSRQVSAPASRYDEGSTGADTPTSYTGTTPTGLPPSGQTEIAPGMASPFSQNASASSAAGEARSTSNINDSIPGDSSSFVTASHTGGSTLSEQAPGKSSTDPFTLNKEQVRSPVAAKNDFDAAFAGFGGPSTTKEQQDISQPSSSQTAKATRSFNTEFPPLRDLEPDDDDSDTSGDHGGFEDDFTSASPGHSRKESSLQIQSSPPPTQGTTDGASSPFPSRPLFSQGASAASIGGDPPTAGTQAPLPTYDKTVSPHERAHAEVAEFSGLLPTREDPTSPPHSSEPPLSSPPLTGGQALFGSLPKATAAQPTPPAKVPFDDFDNDFDDLEDAKEGDADDEFTHVSALDRSGTLDFDPTFDSPAASKTSQHTAHGSSGFGSGFGSESNGFGDFTLSPSTTSAPHPTSAPVTNPVDSHDWDAIFAGLDSTPTATTESSAVTGAAAKTNGTTTAASTRPQLGRALTEAGEHDDPILKDLTAMGYARKDALTALEKYDYNLERVSSQLSRECSLQQLTLTAQAANYLASQS